MEERLNKYQTLLEEYTRLKYLGEWKDAAAKVREMMEICPVMEALPTLKSWLLEATEEAKDFSFWHIGLRKKVVKVNG